MELLCWDFKIVKFGSFARILMLILMLMLNRNAGKFSILGSTGNVYEVRVEQVPSCSCPDFHKRRELCKHLIFVYLKVCTYMLMCCEREDYVHVTYMREEGPS
jgi:hypothetical protein